MRVALVACLVFCSACAPVAQQSSMSRSTKASLSAVVVAASLGLFGSVSALIFDAKCRPSLGITCD